jgi:hypothetical protein
LCPSISIFLKKLLAGKKLNEKGPKYNAWINLIADLKFEEKVTFHPITFYCLPSISL